MGTKKVINTFRDFDYETDVVNDKDFSALGSATMEFCTSGIFKEFFEEYRNDVDGQESQLRKILEETFKNNPLKIKKPDGQNAEKGDVLLSLDANGNHLELFSEFKDLLEDKKIKIGLDMPVLLTPSKGTQESSDSTKSPKPLIIIVGESALRTQLNDNRPRIIHVGTPYAVHQVKGYPEQCDTYKYIFAQLLKISSTGIKEELLKKLLLVKESDEELNPLKDCSIYLTDIIKFWYDGIDLDEDLQKTLNKVLIVKELLALKKGFNPKYIVTFGKRAKRVLNQKKIKKIIKEDIIKKLINGEGQNLLNGLNFIHILHPSGQNAESWKAKIYERALFLWKKNNNDNYAFERYGNTFGSPGETTSKLIAEEAFLEILEGIIKKTTKC